MLVNCKFRLYFRKLMLKIPCFLLKLFHLVEASQNELIVESCFPLWNVFFEIPCENLCGLTKQIFVSRTFFYQLFPLLFKENSIFKEFIDFKSRILKILRLCVIIFFRSFE